MLTRKVQILAVIEDPAEPGVYIEPGVADGFLASDIIATPGFAMFKRNVFRKDLARDPSISGRQSGMITFKVELRGDGTTEKTVPADIALLLGACGFKNSSNTLTPDSETPTPTISIRVEEDGMAKKFRGCAGNVRIVGIPGEPVMLEFAFSGGLETIAKEGPTDITPNETIPPILENAAFSTTLTSEEKHLISTIEFDMQNTVYLRPDVSSPTGILAAIVSDRNPVGSFDPEYNTEYDWLAEIIGNKTGIITLDIGSAAKNKLQITAPAIRFLAMDPGDREGIRILTVPFELNRGAEGDDDIELDWNIT